jgi:hypothetical protein
MADAPTPAPTAPPLRWWQQPALQRLALKLLGGAAIVASTLIENPTVDRVLLALGRELTEQAVDSPAGRAALNTCDGGACAP